MAAGVSNTTWSNWERDGGAPGAKLTSAISDLFDWPMDWPTAELPALGPSTRLADRVAELERSVEDLSKLVEFLMKDAASDEIDVPDHGATRSDPSPA